MARPGGSVGRTLDGRPVMTTANPARQEMTVHDAHGIAGCFLLGEP